MNKTRVVSLATFWGLTLYGVVSRSSAGGLPIPCSTGSCGATGPSGLVTAGSATAVATGNQMTVSQSSNQAILNWANFNIAAGASVTFQQPSATSIALNRIFQASPSTIFGTITANGQIYLINPNGLIFGPTATVNASGILASTLGMSDTTFQEGLVSPAVVQSQQPALASDGRTGVVDNNGNPVLGSDGQQLQVQLQVQNGAQLATTGTGGRILLASQAVSNAGSLSAPGGQVIMAAGSSVYLNASSDPTLRGLLVEVDQGGTAWNTLTGQISTPDGNVTLVGLAVNQDGRISASTSVAANGSVELLAQDTVVHNGNNPPTATHSGAVTLGPSSSIQVLPDLSDPTTEVPDQPQLQSSITISGEQVVMQGGAQITAPDGLLNVTATANPTNNLAPDPQSRIRIDSGVVIDLSGSTAVLPMSANELSVQLNATELANDPLQRNGLLHGQYVTIDTRVGTTLADVSADIAAIPQTVGQRTESGGSAVFQSAGDLAAAPGAVINVSGGETQFLGGNIATTQLVEPNGTIVGIGTADPSQIYSGIINAGYTVKNNTWGVIETIPNTYLGQYQPGYVQGAPAGSLQFSAPAMVLDATLLGQTTAGPYQRTPATAPTGGQLVVGLSSPLPSLTTGLSDDYRSPSVIFTASMPAIVVSDDASLPAGLPLQLPTGFLDNGFTRVAVYSNDSIVVPANTPLAMLPGSSLSLTANDITIDSSISAAGGTLTFNSTLTDGVNGVSVLPPGISFADDITFDVRGNWTNDQLAPLNEQPTSPVYLNGGSISASLHVENGDTLSIGAGDQFQMSGGAWLQSGHTVQYGSGGSLSLTSDEAGARFLIGSGVGLDAFGVGTATGGALNLEADQIMISTVAGSQGWESGITQATAPLIIGTSLFSDYGLSSVNLTANGAASQGAPGTIDILPGTAINAIASSLVLMPGYQFAPSSADVIPISQSQQLPEASRTPMTVSLAAAPTIYSGPLQSPNLVLPAGSSLTGDPRASFALSAVGSITVDGAISAPGGSISLLNEPPPAGQDPGYLATLGISLGSTATLNVAGATVLDPDNPGLLSGNVLAGGSVSLIASRGSVDVATGAFIDIAGTQGLLDVPGAVGAGNSATEVASAAGSLLMQAPDSINWQGSLSAAAGMAPGQSVSGGSLTVYLNSATDGAGKFPTSQRVIEVGAGTIVPAGTLTTTLAYLPVQLLDASGLDKVVLENPRGAISIDPGVSLNLGRELDLDAPLIEVTNAAGSATVGAPYVQIANNFVNTSASLPGSANLTIDGGFIDLVGSTVLSGIDSATIDSTGDLRLTSASLSGTIVGSLSTRGNLTLAAERIYPSTGSTFTLSSTGSSGVLDIVQNGSSPGSPLSVDGAVTFTAPIIQDSGTVLAPFGDVTMTASQTLTLAPGSLTSVSGDGNLYLYGAVVNGQWSYSNQGQVENVTGAPGRQVTLQAPTVSIAQGATVDVSGGGDLFSYQWNPGTGGTVDQLSAAANPNLYAILPSLVGQLAPFDPDLTGSSTPSAGMSVYLSGVPGLPTGVYPLLPARYALLPGAFLVSPVSGTTGISPGAVTTQPDGATVVAGSYVVPGTQQMSAQPVGFAVLPGSYALQLASYTTYTGTSYLEAQPVTTTAGTPAPAPVLPASAGTLELAVSQSLNAEGSVNTTAGSGGQGALVEITAPALEITGSGTSGSGAVLVSSSVVQGWEPGRLLLGGTLSDGGQSLKVSASTVTVDPGTALDLDDITVVANSNITIQSGASLSSPAGGTPPAVVPTNLTLTGSTQPALLELSQGSYEVPTRTADAAGTGATITLAPGSSLTASGSAVIDAPGGAVLGGNLSGVGAQWSLASNAIGFATTPVTGALTITPVVQSALEQGAGLRLSADTINVASPLTLAPASGGLQEITLNTEDIFNFAGNTASNVAAAQITIGNTFGAAATPMAGGTGTLQFTATNVNIGPGTSTFGGFATVGVQASADLTLSGTGGLLVSQDLNLGASRILATSDSNSTLQAGNQIVVAVAGNTPGSSPPAVGGGLSLAANDVSIAGNLQLPSGNITVNAQSSLQIASTATLNVGGETVTAAGRSLESPGGSIDLSSGGSLAISSGAVVSVNGAGGSNAGALNIAATGAAQIDGSLQGQGGQGGSFELTAGSIDSFAALNSNLESGGFFALRNIDLGSGDIALDAGNTLTASQVRLVAETGSVSIGGTVTAPSGAVPSSVDLYGATGVTLSPTARIDADASGTATIGGDITLGTSTGSIDLQPGSVVSARGSAASGSLTLRAPATTNDLAVTEIGADTSGISGIVLEPVQSFGISNAPTDSDLAAIQSQVAAFTTAADPQILGRLGGGHTPLTIQPGIDLVSTGSVMLGSLDLTGWRFGGQPGIVTVRTPGSVTVNGTISDGFTQSDSDNGPIIAPLPGTSSTIQIVAGANTASPDPLGVAAGAASNLTLASGSLLSTGTGAINLAAAQDIVFEPNASVYTGGLTAAPAITVASSGTANFLTNGGNVTLNAGRDVVGSFVQSSPSSWQIRGLPFSNTNGGGAFWGADPTNFNWNVGTLGGGTINVVAGRDVLNLSAASADSGAVTGSTLSTYGGGPLSVSAGRNVDTGYFYVSQGVGDIQAGGGMGSSTQILGNVAAGTMLIVDSAQVNVSARGDILLESAVNSSVIGQPAADSAANFFTYDSNSALNVVSSGGTITVRASGTDASAFFSNAVLNYTNTEVPDIFPATLQLHAFGGNLDLNQASIYLYPSPVGQLDLFAAGSINGGQIVQSDAATGSISTPLNPQAGSGVASGLFDPSQGAIHVGDPAVGQVTAGVDLLGSTFALAKPLDIDVGRNMTDVSVTAQNLQDSDVTEILVGGDLTYDNQGLTSSITVGGPGSLFIAAGGKVDLGLSNGISTIGRLDDPQITAANGANVTVLAGLGTQGEDISDFLTQIVEPSSTYASELMTFVTPSGGSSPAGITQAVTAFDALSPATQQTFINNVFFDALVQAGRLANTNPASDFAGGYAAIDALFPGSRSTGGAPDPYAGDLSLDFSRIYTLQGGSISLFVPGGSVDVGLAVPPVGINVSRTPSQLGIVAQQAGNVDIFSSSDVLVNSSRIFTLGGGNLAIWSTTGNIDAGRGAKSSVSAPPPEVLVDASGNITLDFSGAVAGSGIRTIITQAGESAGNVDLIAPVGFVNAGDAGIGSAGNLNIAARAVFGAQNISVGGVATGVPPEVSGIGAALSGATSAATGTANASSAVGNPQSTTPSATTAAESALSWLDVFVTGVGEENCQPSDTDCIKRQKAATPP